MASFAQVGGVEAVPAGRGFLVREHKNSGVVERVVLWVYLGCTSWPRGNRQVVA